MHEDYEDAGEYLSVKNSMGFTISEGVTFRQATPLSSSYKDLLLRYISDEQANILITSLQVNLNNTYFLGDIGVLFTLNGNIHISTGVGVVTISQGEFKALFGI